jgi:transcriptional regulator with XRE-family HTH domain
MGTARRKLTGVGAVIREYRQRAGISQDALADRMDMSAPYISMLESGTRHPSIEMLVRLAVALGGCGLDSCWTALLNTEPRSKGGRVAFGDFAILAKVFDLDVETHKIVKRFEKSERHVLSCRIGRPWRSWSICFCARPRSA